jgi:hypothetical protein
MSVIACYVNNPVLSTTIPCAAAQDANHDPLKDRLTVVDSKKGTGCGPDVLTGNNWVQVGFLDRSYSLEEGE